MVEKVLQSLEQFEYLMLAICTVGILILLGRAYGIVLSKEGASSNPYANTVGFDSLRDDTGAGSVARSKYEGLAARRAYEGMLGSAEPPVFWGSAYDEDAAGQSQGAGLADDDGSSMDGTGWVPTGQFQNPDVEADVFDVFEGATGRRRVRRRHRKEGMLDAALAGANVTPRSL